MNPTNVSDNQSGLGTTPPPSGAGGAIASAKPGLTAAARDAAGQIKSAATHTASRAREEAARIAAEKKGTAAERIGSYSSAIHESARSLEEKDPNIAWFTHRAADRLQGVADYVRDHDLRDLRYDAEDVARRHPVVFFGGLFVAGLLVGNLMKASARRISDTSDYSSVDQDTSDWAASASTPSTVSAPAPSSGL